MTGRQRVGLPFSLGIQIDYTVKSRIEEKIRRGGKKARAWEEKCERRKKEQVQRSQGRFKGKQGRLTAGARGSGTDWRGGQRSPLE